MVLAARRWVQLRCCTRIGIVYGILATAVVFFIAYSSNAMAFDVPEILNERCVTCPKDIQPRVSPVPAPEDRAPYPAPQFPPGSQPAWKRAIELRAEVWELYSTGRIDEALETLGHALRYVEDRTSSHLELLSDWYSISAVKHEKNQNYPQAIRTINKALKGTYAGMDIGMAYWVSGRGPLFEKRRRYVEHLEKACFSHAHDTYNAAVFGSRPDSCASKIAACVKEGLLPNVAWQLTACVASCASRKPGEWQSMAGCATQCGITLGMAVSTATDCNTRTETTCRRPVAQAYADNTGACRVAAE